MKITVVDRNKLIVRTPGPQGPQGVPGTGGGGSISDGDKGDITVSGSGATWTIDASAVNTSKLGGDITAAGKAILDDADAAAQRATLGLGTAATQPSTSFATSNHTHTASDITSQPARSLVARPDATGGACSAVTLGTGLQFNGSTLETTNLASSSTNMAAGTGLTGGGTIAADRTFAVDFATSGTSSATQAVRADDSRLSDARTPTAHTHALADIQQGGAASGEVLKWNGSAWAPSADLTGSGSTGAPTNAQYFTLSADASLTDERVLTFGTGLNSTDGGAGSQYDVEVTYGTTQGTACEGNDSRLSDNRNPTAHTHDLVDSYVGHIAAPAADTYYVDTYAATARTITGIHIVVGSDTVDFTLYRRSSGLATQIYTANGQGTTQSNVTSGLTNTSISAGDQIELVIDAVSGTPADLRFAVVYSRTTGAIT